MWSVTAGEACAAGAALGPLSAGGTGLPWSCPGAWGVRERPFQHASYRNYAGLLLLKILVILRDPPWRFSVGGEGGRLF